MPKISGDLVAAQQAAFVFVKRRRLGPNVITGKELGAASGGSVPWASPAVGE
jgi:hypothetical protein